ncbi:hypothetical protein AgCh_015834 [Apium graveolens]
MTDSFIPVPADHSEPSVGGPSSDPRPALPPVLAILSPVVTVVPLRAIPPPGMRAPIRGPPPADSDSTGHSIAGSPFQSTLHHIPYYRSVRELREEIHATRRVLEARLHGAICEYAGPGAFMGWAREAVNPPEFKGSLDPIEARVWLKEIEKSFALVKVKEEQKVKFSRGAGSRVDISSGFRACCQVKGYNFFSSNCTGHCIMFCYVDGQHWSILG